MKKIFYTLLVILLTTNLNIYSQVQFQTNDLPLFIKDYDLTSINVDQLSDQEIGRIVDELENNNLNFSMLKPIAISNGISEENFEKLETRILQFLSVQDIKMIDSNVQTDKEPIFNQYRNKNQVGKIKKNKKLLKDEIFGSELFSNTDNPINLNSIIPPPLNYVIGFGDELQINIYGTQQLNIKSKVLADGNINIPNVGYIPISGLSIKNATKKLKNDLSKIYKSLQNNSSNLNLNVSKVRTVNVTIIGSNYPGVYSLSAANSVFDAVQLGGGPSNTGSFRNIELIRDGKVINSLDLYEFMISPNHNSNISLSNNDIIRIPVYSNQIRIKGEVKRPGLFELKEGETFTNLIKYASGFTNNAYRDEIKIIQKSNNQFRLQEVKNNKFDSYFPKDGDVIEVGQILNRYENRVQIQGSVYRPGQYSLSEGMTIRDLIIRAEGLTENADIFNARVLRQLSDLTKESLSFNVKEVLENNLSSNFVLKNEDIVEIFKVDNEKFSIQINGLVFNPGLYDYFNGITLGNLISSAGGLLEDSSGNIEIARRIIGDKGDIASESIDLSYSESKNFLIKKYDVINVREKEGLKNPKFIKIEGAVKVPGYYAIENFNDQIDYYINKAKGLLNNADPSSIKILRNVKLKKIINDSLVGQVDFDEKLGELAIETKQIVIPVSKINGKDSYEISLKNNDIIRVDEKTSNVSVTGEVQLNSEIPFKKGANLRYYINAVGGKNKNADIKSSYVIYPNGQAKNYKRFLFIGKSPKITQGSQIVVPSKSERNKVSVGELIGYTSALTSVATILISIINK